MFVGTRNWQTSYYVAHKCGANFSEPPFQKRDVDITRNELREHTCNVGGKRNEMLSETINRVGQALKKVGIRRETFMRRLSQEDHSEHSELREAFPAFSDWNSDGGLATFYKKWDCIRLQTRLDYLNVAFVQAVWDAF